MWYAPTYLEDAASPPPKPLEGEARRRIAPSPFGDAERLTISDRAGGGTRACTHKPTAKC